MLRSSKTGSENGLASTASYAECQACGESSNGRLETIGETSLVEAGTEHWIWLVHIWVSFG